MFSLIGRAAFGKRFHVIELDKPSRRTAPAVCGDEGALPALPKLTPRGAATGKYRSRVSGRTELPSYKYSMRCSSSTKCASIRPVTGRQKAA